MSWMPGWKRQVETFHLVLGYGGKISQTPSLSPISSLPRASQSPDFKSETVSPFDPSSNCRYRIQVDWSSTEDDEQVALRLQSQLMVTLPPPQDSVEVKFAVVEPSSNNPFESDGSTNAQISTPVSCESDPPNVKVEFRVHKQREPLKVVVLSRSMPTTGVPGDGLSILTRVLDPTSLEKVPQISVTEQLLGFTQHWRTLSVLCLTSCSLVTVPAEIMRLPMLEALHLDHNKLTSLPSDLGVLSRLKILNADHNLLTAVPIEMRQCTSLEEISFEHNKLVRPLLDFRSLVHLQVLRLFGNPLEFLPEILPCRKLRVLTLANVRIESDAPLTIVNVHIESESQSYFGASKHKLSAFFSLIFRYSSVHHPLLASALAKISEDSENRKAIGKDEGAIRQIVSMLISESQHVVEQACLALSSLATDTAVVLKLAKANVVTAVISLLHSSMNEILISALRVISNLAFSSDFISSQILTQDTVATLSQLILHPHVLVQSQALMALGNLSFCLDNRKTLLATQGLMRTLLDLSKSASRVSENMDVPSEFSVQKAAIRVLAILGENELLRVATKSRAIRRRGVRILSMDGGGMRGMATVQMLREIENGTGKKIHELFDLICGTSTGGMLSVGIGIKKFKLDHCDEIYKTLGKLVFVNVEQNESATWREKIDQIYKSSSQNLRVMVHGSKHNAEEFERLLKEMCEEEDGDLLIESAIKGGPKVFVVSTLVTVNPAAPFIFRNYQYPPGILETPLPANEGLGSTSGTSSSFPSLPSSKSKVAMVGSCKFCLWEAIRASSAAPYYLDDFSSGGLRWQDGAIVANNPTILGIKEARLLWPDIPIDCVVSLGSGQLPAKIRGKGGWRLADTGQVLIESVCSVERAEECLDTFLPMIPDIKYFRFNPTDDRCGMELDETDPSVWQKLEAATAEYIQANKLFFDDVCKHLGDDEDDADADVDAKDYNDVNNNDLEKSESGYQTKKIKGKENRPPKLGFRKKLLLVEGRRSPEISKPHHHSRVLENILTKHFVKFDVHVSTQLPPHLEPNVLSNETLHPITPDVDNSLEKERDAAGVLEGQKGVESMEQKEKEKERMDRRRRSRSGDGSPFSSLDSNSFFSNHNAHIITSKSSTNSPIISSQLSIAESSPLSSFNSKKRDKIPPLDLNRESSFLGGQEEMRKKEDGSSSSFFNSTFWHPPPLSSSLSPSKILPPHALHLMQSLEKSNSTFGIIHLALHCDSVGFILSWQNDIISIPFPGGVCSSFLEDARNSIQESYQMQKKTKKKILKVKNLSDLVETYPRFFSAGALFKFMGRYTQVTSDGEEVGAYLFRRTLPAVHLTVDDIRWMIGAWRDQIVICSGFYSPPRFIIDALLEGGAKAVISPLREFPSMDSTLHPPLFNKLDENGKLTMEEEKKEKGGIENGYEGEEGEDIRETNEFAMSDWDESSEEEDGKDAESEFEKDMGEFLGSLYMALYRKMDVIQALHVASREHPSQKFKCHLSKDFRN